MRVKEEAGQVRMDTIVNFEHLKLAAANTLKALIDSEALKVVIPHVKVRYRKFKVAFEASLLVFPLAGLEHLNEDLHDA